MLDGNAAAGLLEEIFSLEMTVSWTTCAYCGARGQMGALHLYDRAPGLVFRCPICRNVEMKIVKGRDRYFIDLTGVRRLEVETS